MAPPSGSMEEILILSRREEPEIYREIDQNFISKDALLCIKFFQSNRKFDEIFSIQLSSFNLALRDQLIIQ